MNFVSRKKKSRQIDPFELKERGKRIKYLRKLLRYSAKALAEKCDTKESTFKSWEQGRFTGLTTNGALQIIEICQKEGIVNCGLEWLLHGKGAKPELRAGLTPFSGNSAIEELRLFHQLHPDAIDTIVSDDSLEPFFSVGEHVAGLRRFEDKINGLLGLNCIVQLQTGEILIRKLLTGDEPCLYDLAAIHPTINQPVLRNVQLFSAAYIVWTRKPDLAE